MNKPSIKIVKNGVLKKLSINFVNGNEIPSDFSYAGNYLSLNNCIIPNGLAIQGYGLYIDGVRQDIKKK